MKLNNSSAEIFVPDNKPVEEAIKRTTHMAIAAHQDDIEIMAHHGILECFGNDDKWFLGTVVTNGAGSSRDDLYASYSDEEMQKVRKLEQKKAAFTGEYSAVALLDYSSSAVKDPENPHVIDELIHLVTEAKPGIIYTHNLADKHDTHVGVAVKTILALRQIPEDAKPEKLYGCEVWRDLDWMVDEDKISFDVSSHPNLAASLVGVFDSQICGGKRYDLATSGRRMANATYAQSHDTDTSSSLIYGMDLTPLIYDINLDINQFIQKHILNFSCDVANRIKKLE